ncbi:MAG: amidohydrolase family protein [Acidobacteria bacterium]|nr:amidohydrolase family protein [Acidobacteriota bacterium]
MTVAYRAHWVLPIVSPRVTRGWVHLDRGRILAVGGPGEATPAGIDVVDLGRVAILPGLVNAHTHLELSWMADRVPPASAMPAWAAALVSLRATAGPDPVPPIEDAIRGARTAGTALAGDVTNTLASYKPLADSRLAAAIFRELLGFNSPDPQRLVADARRQLDGLGPLDRLRPFIAPHAPFSVSPELFRAIARQAGTGPLSVHLAESAEEIQFLRDGTGAWRDLLGRLGAWNERWAAPGCGPVEYLDRLGLVSRALMAVHCVHATDGDLQRLSAARATVVTCPRSNRWTGAGTPPIERFYASGVRVAIGTDSLASVEDLNLFAELAEVRRLAPSVPAARLLESATRHGADALGFGAEFGTIEPGKRADLIAVSVPSAVEDVEEYLVRGIEPPSIQWVGEPEEARP